MLPVGGGGGGGSRRLLLLAIGPGVRGGMEGLLCGVQTAEDSRRTTEKQAATAAGSGWTSKVRREAVKSKMLSCRLGVDEAMTRARLGAGRSSSVFCTGRHTAFARYSSLFQLSPINFHWLTTLGRDIEMILARTDVTKRQRLTVVIATL